MLCRLGMYQPSFLIYLFLFQLSPTSAASNHGNTPSISTSAFKETKNSSKLLRDEDLSTWTEAGRTDSSMLEETTENGGNAAVTHHEKSLPSRLLILKEARQFLLFKVGRGFAVFYSPVMSVFGLCGNALTAAVMFQSHNRLVSSCIYMGCLAVADMLPLLINLSKFFTDILFPLSESRLFCQITEFIRIWGSLVSTWIIVAMTIERSMVIMFPLKSKQLQNPRRSYGIVVSIMVLSGLARVTRTIFFIDSFPTGTGSRFCAISIDDLIGEIERWTDATLSCYIPFAVLLVLNILIISSVRKSRKDFMGNATDSEKRKKEELQITISLVIVVTAFIICTAPTYTVNTVLFRHTHNRY